MNFNEYQVLARRTQNAELSREDMLNHALRGLASECGEINGIYQKALQGHEVDREHVAEELGDLLWFCAELADSIGVQLGSVANSNIVKLMARYPDGFDADRSVNRDE